MKKPPDAGAADADGISVPVSNPATFRIIKTTRVDFGSKKAELSVAVDGIGVLFVDVFKPQDRPPFVAPKSIRSKYTGAYERAYRLDDGLAVAILAAFLTQEERL